MTHTYAWVVSRIKSMLPPDRGDMPDSATLQAIRERTEKLNHIDDQIANVIKHAEEAIKKVVNVRIQHKVEDAESPVLSLSWGKLHGEWGLLVTLRVSGQTERLTQSSRTTRAHVVAKRMIESLLCTGLVQLEQMIVERETALAEAERIVKALEEFPKKEG